MFGKSRQDNLHFVNFDIILLLQIAIRSIFEKVTVFHMNILSLHPFLNKETLLLGKESRFMTLICHAHERNLEKMSWVEN